MSAIKSYTDLEQSKKLAEILPLESADMCYLKREINDTFIETPIIKPKGGVFKSLPCWSLSALLGVLPIIRKGEDTANPFIAKTPDNEYYIVYATLTKEVDASLIYDNPVDACVDMIRKLNKLNLL